MSDQPAAATLPTKVHHDPAQTPVIFADGVANLARGPGLVKFYLVRFDPDLAGQLPNSQTTAAQVVMTANGFAAMVLFFQKQLAAMLEKGEIDQGFFSELVAAAEADAKAAKQ